MFTPIRESSGESRRCKDDPGEYISCAEWDNEKNIRKYLRSVDHQEIKRHNENIIGAKVVVKQYEVVS
jgi:heme-degrading monooxygenase HmoA